MKILITTTVLAALAGVSVNAYSAQDKVLICHNYQTISVARAAKDAHLNHGDFAFEDEESKDRACEKASDGSETGTEGYTYVVTMRCEDTKVISLDDSSDAGIDAVPTGTCAQVLSEQLERGLKLESVTGGSATGPDDDLHLYADHLLLGKPEAAGEDEVNPL